MMRRVRVIAIAVTVALGLASLSPAQSPERGGTASPQGEQIAYGGEVWDAQCARCHDFSRSRPGFARYGGDIRQRELAWHGSMERLAHYVTHYMPFDLPNVLSQPEYDAVLAFLLERVDLLPIGVVVSPETYSSIELPDYRKLSTDMYEIWETSRKNNSTSGE